MTAWPSVALGDLCEIRIGRTPSRSRADFWGDGYPWLSIADMNQGRSLFRTKESITPLAVREAGCKAVESGTVLLSFKLSIGKVGIAKRPLFTNEAIAGLPISRPGVVTPDYLYWALRTMDVSVGFNRAAMGATLNKAALQRLQVPLAPLSQQQRIADVLDRADALRTTRGTALARIDNLMTAAFAETMAHETWGGGTARPLGEHVERITVGHVGPTSEFFSPNGVPFLRTGNIGDLEIRTVDLRRVTQEFHDNHMKSALVQGDLLVSRVVSDEVRCAVVPAELAGSNCANVIIIRPGDRVSGEFLAYLIRSAASQRSLLGRRVGSAQSVVNTGVLQSWKVALPSIDVQEQFTVKAAAVRKLKAKCVASNVALELVFASLQQRAFAGVL